MFAKLAPRLLVLALVSPFAPAYAGAAEYGTVLVIEPGRFLTEDDRMQLEKEGVRVLRELGGDRYLVRKDQVLSATSQRARAALANAAALSARMVGVEAALGAEETAEIQVLFFDDVTPGDALQAIIAAGGVPLHGPEENGVGRVSIHARLSRGSVAALAAGDLVQVMRHRPLQIESDNATAAELSNVPEVRESLGLTGEGVVASVYEISPLQADHVEFEGRASSPQGTPETHATHVAGTIGAAGVREQARGMAPKVTIAGHVVNLDFTDSKRDSFREDEASVDNNSWSFVLGWNYDSARSLNWEWWGFIEEFGAYTPDTEDLDRLALTVPTLMVYSAGNDNTDSGPGTSPWAHYHGNEDQVWCASASGSGTDCPANPCGTRCEKTRHPADGPWTSVSLVGSLKNGLAVGAVSQDLVLASFSSRGPAVDGRVKPEVVAKGVSQYSSTANNSYGYLSGTSMAAPVVTGVGALLTEQWRRTFHGNPRPEFLKTVIIHGAEDIGNDGPDYSYGFGLVDAGASARVIASTTDDERRIRTGSVARDQRWQSSISVEAGDEVRLTLGWADPANVAYTVPALVNDLDLSLIGPGGEVIRPWVLDPDSPDSPAVRGMNTVDNTERIDAILEGTGTWTVEVAGRGVSTTAAQSFILVSSHVLAPGRAACMDPYEPNETPATAHGIPADRLIRASLCGESDRDYYHFGVSAGGTITIVVTSEVPTRLALMRGSEVLDTIDLDAGESREVEIGTGTIPGSGTPASFFVRVEPLADVEGEYTLQVDWPGAPPALRRGVRR